MIAAAGRQRQNGGSRGAQYYEAFAGGAGNRQTACGEFTNAAASEMRQRIGVAIAKQLEETPEDIHLQNQMAFLPRADIKTIHAFCLQ